MNKVAGLNKQFKEKDVQRLRNIVTKKTGDKNTVSVGYQEKEIVRKEGDIWEVDGKKWTIKEGIRQNITKLDIAKENINLPLFCPECNSVMNGKHDKTFYLQYNHCFNCQIDFETDLRRLGLFEDYVKNIVNSDMDSLSKEYEIFMDEEIENSGKSFITEQGDVEKWSSVNKSQLIKNKEEVIKYLQSLKR